MKNALYIGLGIVALIGIVSLVMQDPNIMLTLSGLVTVICLILAGVFSGATGSGDQNRANFHTETKKQRHERTGMAMIFVLIGLPNLFTAILAYVYIT
ncbi:DUF5316 domain-containing protein [Salipaludibacillus daqingensis]|uniref:DUF5316 domain-containing protein n=1 Tax=Salipaludibacillus daqingensis TaxID=3041001 RepID=UPI002474895E|nr:DUF5316 domain-containing protein [Salipaludibacillus daqingensis]